MTLVEGRLYIATDAEKPTDTPTREQQLETALREILYLESVGADGDMFWSWKRRVGFLLSPPIDSAMHGVSVGEEL